MVSVKHTHICACTICYSETLELLSILVVIVPIPYMPKSSVPFHLLQEQQHQVCTRSFIFPFLIRGGKPTPFFTCLLAFIFCTYNGYLQGRSLSNYVEYPSNWLTDPRFILGVIAWISGLAINIHSDHILRNLRKPGETGYKIPRGGMFEYVTGANYFGEVVEWFGFALACCTIQSAAFAISTLLILALRSYKHHEWYHKRFENYPYNRKILIPYLF
ncbi:3-oxo-5-alpha-steroid 4-dehydrogenase 1 [Sceloporus undulatus]|uniref:3-oxo-5-alpha-steroid 4-dehydrogenase 1 n=1 Tax=Sceloporus undulatus TaxID=8520 RepID=UPI001C4D386F|nr:3-oxo-5-alpha-steroid 4-dehydrogenase 1 [Sceloporus undulatus]